MYSTWNMVDDHEKHLSHKAILELNWVLALFHHGNAPLRRFGLKSQEGGGGRGGGGGVSKGDLAGNRGRAG